MLTRLLQCYSCNTAAQDHTERTEVLALDLYEQQHSAGPQYFIVPPTESVLRRLEERPRYTALIRLFLERVGIAFPARYCKHWVRRLQQYGFTPEDASVLALATFGTDQDTSILGMHGVVTFDQAMMTQWTVQYPAIQAHLSAMLQDLPMPYCYAALPEVLRPGDVLPT